MTSAMNKSSSPSIRVHGNSARYSVIRRLPVHLVLLAIALFSLLPLLYMVSTSVKADGMEFAVPIEWIPQVLHPENYARAFIRFPTLTFLRNSVIIVVFCLVGEVLTGAMVAYGFARARFPGRQILFFVMLSTMMLPQMVTLIPQFILFRELGWINTFLPLIVPAFFGGHPFYIFLLRQFFMGLPAELEDAARIDGAGFFRIWWSVALPLAKPGLTTVAILSILTHWNDFTTPLIYLKSTRNFTVALGIHLFKDSYQMRFNQQMAYAVMMTLPVFLLFFLFQKNFIRGITFSGMGGR